MAPGPRRAARGSLVAGLGAVATLPIAVYLTRYGERYELIHAGFAIPLALGLGITALMLAGRERRRSALTLGREGSPRRVAAGRVLGIVGICLALAALVSLGVYALLEYVGSRS